jgi:hypothetical protein
MNRLWQLMVFLLVIGLFMLLVAFFAIILIPVLVFLLIVGLVFGARVGFHPRFVRFGPRNPTPEADDRDAKAKEPPEDGDGEIIDIAAVEVPGERREIDR